MLPNTHPLHDVWEKLTDLATAAFLRELGAVEDYLKNVAPPKPAVSIELALPEVYNREGKRMPLSILNTEIHKYRILTRDADGETVSAPATDTFSVTPDASGFVGIAIDKMADGSPAVMFTPLKRATTTPIAWTLSDSAGLTVDSDTVEIVTNLTPTAVGLDLAAPEVTAQAEPPA